MVTFQDFYSFAAGQADLVLRNDMLTSLAILVLSIVGARALHFVLERYVTRLTKATKTTLDDEMLAALKKPIYIAALVVGVYFSLVQVDALIPYGGVIDSGFVVVLVIVGAYTLSRAVSTFINWYSSNLAASSGTAVDQTFMPAVRKIVSVFIYIIGAVIILDHLGVRVTALVASLGVASLAVALALQDTLSNFFAGLYIMADKPFRQGDLVRLESGEEGKVVEIGWRSTKLKVGSGNILIIPNSKLAQSRITNFYLPARDTGFSVPCGVAYGSDLDKVEAVTVKAARDVLKKSGMGARGFEPSVRFSGFGDSNIQFSVALKIDSEKGDRAVVTHELIKALTAEYKKEKIEISWPVRKVYSHRL